MKKTFTLSFFFVLASLGFAQTPTWEKQISCILFSHCTNCHNSNGLAPFPLTSYYQAYNNRLGILNDVTSKKMPPYSPDVTYSHFADEKVLTAAEITLITDWVNAGAPSGDTTQALPPPVYSTADVITAPDLVGRMPHFTIPNTGSDLYQAFIITNPNPTAKYITDIEVVPGNRNVVHHVLVFQDASSAPVTNDSAYAGAGYVSFGGIGSQSAELMTGWVPGSGVFSLPTGMGIMLNVGSRIIVQIHYPMGSQGQIDSTKVNIKYTTTPLRNVSTAPLLSQTNLTNGPLSIPANTVKTFYSQRTIASNITVLSIAPHAHLIAKSFEVYGIAPPTNTINLIKINDWDFHWQGLHGFRQPIKIPAGTVLHGTAYYDNTTNNPDNPSSPPQNVSLGEATTDEMMLVYFSYLPYQTGDENIIIDTTSHLAHYQNCIPEALISGITKTVNNPSFFSFPNPASNQINIQASGSQNLTVEIINALGEVVLVSQNQKQLDVSGLDNGIYFMQAIIDNKKFNQKIIVQK